MANPEAGLDTGEGFVHPAFVTVEVRLKVDLDASPTAIAGGSYRWLV
ncbi:MAG TPA: hypothetical protein VGH33_21945 [Isosphaeraceae bacterium]